MKPNKNFLKNRLTDWSTYQQSTDYSIYCIKMQLKTKKPSATGLHNNALKNEKDIDMICWFGPKWDIISYLISPEFWGYYIISYIPPRDIISDIDMQRHISFLPLRYTHHTCSFTGMLTHIHSTFSGDRCSGHPKKATSPWATRFRASRYIHQRFWAQGQKKKSLLPFHHRNM